MLHRHMPREHSCTKLTKMAAKAPNKTNMTPLQNDSQQHPRVAKHRTCRISHRPGLSPNSDSTRNALQRSSLHLNFGPQTLGFTCDSGPSWWHHDGGTKVDTDPAVCPPMYNTGITEICKSWKGIVNKRSNDNLLTPRHAMILLAPVPRMTSTSARQLYTDKLDFRTVFKILPRIPRSMQLLASGSFVARSWNRSANMWHLPQQVWGA
jgi:hypothetical protein